MVKKISVLIAVVALFSFIPVSFAANISVSETFDVLISDPNPDITLQVIVGGQLDEIYVTGSSVRFTVPSANALEVRCTSCSLTNDGGLTQTCEGSVGSIRKGINSAPTQFTVTPTNTASCTSGGGGGGGGGGGSSSGGTVTTPSAGTPTGGTVLETPPETGETTPTVQPVTTKTIGAVTFKAFADYNVLVKHWALQYIERVYQAKIMTGQGNFDSTIYTFNPNAFMNRAELAKVAMVTLGQDPLITSGYPFPDVADMNLWFFGWVQRAKFLEFFTGDAEGNFNPSNNSTRAEVAVVFARMTGEALPKCTEKPFFDVAINHFACSHISLMKRLGFMRGYVDENEMPTGEFRPGNPMTRAEIAVMITKTLDYLAQFAL